MPDSVIVLTSRESGEDGALLLDYEQSLVTALVVLRSSD
jgi:hypothetical protein